MKNIQVAMFPLLFVLCLCGLGVFEYPRGRSRLYLTIFYILASWLFHIYIIIQINMFLNEFMVTIPMFLKVTIVFGIMYTLLGVYHNKRFKNFFRKLNIVSDTLEKLGIPKNYVKLRVQVIWIITGWIISMLLINTLNSLWFLAHIPTSYVAITICLPFVVNYSFHIDILHDVMYLTLLWYIGSLFEHVNRYIQELTEQEEIKKKKERVRFVPIICALSSRHETNTMKLNQAIYILMHVHFELSMILQEFSKIFEWQMLMQIVAFYIFTVQLIIEFYNIVIRINANTHFTYQMVMDTVDIFMWIINGVIRMFLFNYMCEKTYFKANRTEVLLNRLANISFDVKMRENITQFLLQLLKKPLTVSVFGIFNFGYKFLYTVCNFRTNYTKLLLLENSKLINSFNPLISNMQTLYTATSVM